MTHCYFCDRSDATNPNVKITYHGKRDGKRVQKTVRICNVCAAMMNDEEIKETISELEGWDYNDTL